MREDNEIFLCVSSVSSVDLVQFLVVAMLHFVSPNVWGKDICQLS